MTSECGRNYAVFAEASAEIGRMPNLLIGAPIRSRSIHDGSFTYWHFKPAGRQMCSMDVEINQIRFFPDMCISISNQGIRLACIYKSILSCRHFISPSMQRHKCMQET